MPKFDQFTGKSCVPAEELHVLEGHTGTRLHRNRWRRDSIVEQLAGNSEAVVSDPADTHDMDKLKVVEDERVIKFINARWKKDNPTAGGVGMANGFHEALRCQLYPLYLWHQTPSHSLTIQRCVSIVLS